MPKTSALRGKTRASAAFAAACVLASCVLGCADSVAPPRYSGVVVVVLDTVRADHCGLFGHDAPTSPAMDRLARSARTYETCWSPSPWTSPAHASLFTGQLPDRHGLRRLGTMYLKPGADTLAGRLRAAGYATGGFSGSPNASAMVGLDQGFEHFELLPGDVTMGEPLAPGETGYADNIARRTLDWVAAQRAGGRRFFAFVNIFDAHLPYDPPLAVTQPFVAHRPFQLVEWGRRVDHPFPMAFALGLGPLSGEQLGTLAELYDAEISMADRALHTLVEGLERLGGRDDTLLVVLADHGENIGDHGLMDHMLSVHRSLLHVPLVIRAPGVLDDGARVAELVRVEDVAPTVLELCGLPPFAAPDGVSLLQIDEPRVAHGWLDPLLPSQVERFQSIFVDSDLTTVERARRSVFDGRYHLIAESGLPDRLHDVVADPGELSDIAAERPQDVQRLRALIDERDRDLRSDTASSPR